MKVSKAKKGGVVSVGTSERGLEGKKDLLASYLPASPNMDV